MSVASAPVGGGIPESPGQLQLAMRYLARAVGRLETLLILGVGGAVLTLIADAVKGAGLSGLPLQIYGISWGPVLGTALTVAITIAIVLLVLLGLLFAITGFIAWRRGVWALRRARRESVGERADALRASVEEEHQIWVSVLLLIGVAIMVGFAIGITDAALLLSGSSAIPASLATLAEGFATGAVLILVYLRATRHLSEALQAAAPYVVSPHLRDGQRLIIAGAILGCIGSLSSVFWPIELVSIVGLTLILVGIGRFRSAFDSVVAVLPRGGSGEMASPAV